MSLKISNSNLVSKHYITVDSGGVQYFDNALIGGLKRVPFANIDCILMSPDHKLSLQMGTQVYTVQVNPEDPDHQTVINALLQEVRRSVEA